MDQIVATVIWAAILQGLLLGLVFTLSKKHRSPANRILGYLMFAFVLAALSDLLPYSQLGNYTLGYFSLPEVKMFFPVLYLHFILLKVGNYPTYRRLIQIHYGIALSINLLFAANVILYLSSGTSLYDHLDYGSINDIFMTQQYYAFFLSLVALAISIREALRYGRVVRGEVSDFSMLNFTWLWQFIGLTTLIVLFWGLELRRILLGGHGQSVLTLYAFLIIALLNYFVSYKAFIHRTLFEDDGEPEIPQRQQEEDESQVSSPVAEEVCHSVQKVMEEYKYYLLPNLTIHEFSKKSSVPARSISWCINNHSRLNFNEWVNSYRVKHALELLKDPKMDHLSIEGIGYDSGFTSRSAMYAAFKKELGKSPGHFR